MVRFMLFQMHVLYAVAGNVDKELNFNSLWFETNPQTSIWACFPSYILWKQTFDLQPWNKLSFYLQIENNCL